MESFLHKAGTKASSTGMGCKEGGRERTERTAKKAPGKPHVGGGGGCLPGACEKMGGKLTYDAVKICEP